MVKRGANRRKFVVVKNHDGTPGDLLAYVRDSALTDEGRARVEKAVGQAAAAQDGQARLNDRAQAAMKAVARILAPFADQLTQDDLASLGVAVGLGQDDEVEGDTENDPTLDDALGGAAGSVDVPEEKLMADANKPPFKDVTMDMEPPVGVEDGDHKMAMGAAKKAYMASLAKKDYNCKGDDEGGDEEEDSMSDVSMAKKKVDKSAVALSAFAPEQQAQLEAVFKSNAMLQQQNKDLIAKTAEMAQAVERERDIRLSAEFIAKAEGFKNLSCDKADLASTLRGFHDRGDTEGLEKIERVLKAADAQAAAGGKFGGLFSVKGASARPSTVGSANQKLDALVDGQVAKAAGGKTRAQIYTEVLDTPEGQALYAQSVTEARRAQEAY